MSILRLNERVGSPQCSLGRLLVIILVLICFAGMQTASVVVDHAHAHGGTRDHCCPICHASHVPALQAMAVIQIAAPAGVSWHGSRERALVAGALRTSWNPGRAPPA